MKEIGGYFELEINKGAYSYHDTPYVMKSGRAALHHILTSIKPKLVYLPFYTCDSLLEPFAATDTSYTFYAINELLEPAHPLDLKEGEYFLYINYFGLKTNTVRRLSEQYGNKLIADCTQAFFMKGNNVSWAFNSCRKFFGVPDGSYLYAPEGISLPAVETRNEEYLTTHLLNRFNGNTRGGYEFFMENERLAGKGTSGISRLSEYLLSNIDYDEVMEKRKANYSYLHTTLKDMNLFKATLNDGDVPMSYPLLLNKCLNREALSAQNIFIPSFWRDVQQRGAAGFDFEKSLADHLFPLPIDHRYSPADMETICTSLITLMQ